MSALGFSEDQGSFVLIASAGGLTLFVGFLLFYLRKQDGDSLKEIPGSLGWPLIGEDRAFWAAFSNPERGIYDFAFQRHKKYGSIFKTKLMGKMNVFVGESKAAKQVMLGEFKIVRSTAFSSSLKVLGYSSLFTGNLTEELHKRMRQVGGELFTQEHLKRSLGKVEETALGILRGWAGQTVRVMDETSRYSFHIIALMILSIAPGPELDKMRTDFGALCSGLSSMPYMFLHGRFYKAMMARERMYKMILDLVRKRENGEKREDDFLQFLVDRKQEGYSDAFSDDQLFDFVLGLMIAGFETTSTTLIWILKNLEEHPLVLKSLQLEGHVGTLARWLVLVPTWILKVFVQEEHRGIQERRLDGEVGLAWEDTKNMPYTLQVIYESMRLSNPIRWVTRQAAEDFKLNDYKLKKGWRITVDISNLHHDPALHKDPSTFNPSRFNSEMMPYAFMGFGAGPRMCLGINLAKMELLVFLHHLVTMYRWECVNKDYTMAPTIVAKHKSGYPIHVESLVKT